MTKKIICTGCCFCLDGSALRLQRKPGGRGENCLGKAGNLVRLYNNTNENK